MSRGPDAETLLHRALARHAAAHGCAIALDAAETSRWASATFAGTRHRLSVRGPAGGPLDAWLAGLDDADLPLRGHLVADIVVQAVRHEAGVACATIEALTVEV